MAPNRPDEPSWLPPPDPTRDTHSAWEAPEAATTPMPQAPTYPKPSYDPPAPNPQYPPYGPQGPQQGYGQWPAPAPSAPSAWTPPPNNHLVWAILVTLFCFLPFGVVSIVKASSVNTFWAQGRWQEAHNAAASARTWAIWSMATVPLVCVVYALGFAVFRTSA